MQKPAHGHLRRDLKPLTQTKWPRAAEWFRLARGGHLTYLHRHLFPEHLFPQLLQNPRLPRARSQAESAAWNRWDEQSNLFLTLHWMCTYIDALSAPTIDGHQLERIQWLCKKATWHWYTYLDKSMHTLLAHAMLHLAEQAEEYGPLCTYWLFHKERSNPLMPYACDSRAVPLSTAGVLTHSVLFCAVLCCRPLCRRWGCCACGAHVIGISGG